MKKVAVLCSGGDAPGMNAAVRAVVRTSISQGVEPLGVKQGFQGLIDGHFIDMNLGSVANIIQRGGTILKAGRCPEFNQQSYRKKAIDHLLKNQVDGMIIIGGDGSFHGAQALAEESHLRVIGIPGTIDNDIYGSELTIGFDTAINTATDAIDRIRDTAASHDRLFIVEVMGRDSGFIAVEVGLAGGAEEIFVPEFNVNLEGVIQHIKTGMQRGKYSSILVTAEGQKPGRAYDLAEAIRKKAGFDAKVCILGHIQRGGKPTAADRNLASRMGAAAVTALLEGHTGLYIGVQNSKLVRVGFKESLGKTKDLDQQGLQLAQILSL